MRKTTLYKFNFIKCLIGMLHRTIQQFILLNSTTKMEIPHLNAAKIRTWYFIIIFKLHLYRRSARNTEIGGLRVLRPKTLKYP